MTGSRREHPGEPLFQKLSFLLLVVVISGAFIYMVRDFVLTLVMAAVFTGLTFPIYAFLLRRLHKPALASAAVLILLLVVLVLPVAAVITVAYHEAWDFFQRVDFAALPGKLAAVAEWFREQFPVLFARLSPEDISQATTLGIKQIFQIILKHGAGWSVAAAGNLANILLMFFMMFYFYVDGKRLLRKLILLSPLRDDIEKTLIRNFLAVSRATLKGILVIGVIQGTIGALLFWSTGLRSPVFLGVLMIFCTVIPVAGTGLVWVPAALFLFFTGHIGAGIVVVAVGALIIGSIDNFLRPMLVGKEIKMHDLLVLLSTLGGLGMFGLTGFIIGPVLASFFLSVWAMFQEVFTSELSVNQETSSQSPVD